MVFPENSDSESPLTPIFTPVKLCEIPSSGTKRALVGLLVGSAVILAVGETVGVFVGTGIGATVGVLVGVAVGVAVGRGVGTSVGKGTGGEVGVFDGDPVGADDGVIVGRGLPTRGRKCRASNTRTLGPRRNT